MEKKSKDEKHHGRITINVGGQRHETYLSTLRNLPDTRLFWITEQHNTSAKSPEYNAERKEYFFDRHPVVFAHIVNYYRTGKLHCPMDVCGPLFEEELSFWGIDERQVELCCWENYKQHKEKQEKLKYFTPLSELDEEDEDELLENSFWQVFRRKGRAILEKPSSSILAKVVTILNVVTFLITVVQFCLTTLKSFREDSHRAKILSGIRLYCVTWFLLEFVLRLLFTASLVEHFKKILHWLDLISVCAFIVHVKIHHNSVTTEIAPFEMLIFLKVARLFNLLTFSFVIQVLTNTLKASSRELCLLTIIVLFQAFVFSAVLFFIERDDSSTRFESIPDSLWWAIITMTTVGYGDIQPETWMGKILGCCCALCGVLVIALPVSVVATNFSLFYTYAKARLNLPPKLENKLPLSKALTSLKAKKDQLPHGITNHSISSIGKKFEQTPKESTELLSPENEEKATESSSYKSSGSERKRNDSSTLEQNLPFFEKPEISGGEAMIGPLTPFMECNFDFLEVPRNKRLKKSFLSTSISRVFGAKTQTAKNNIAQESMIMLDIHSRYPLYSRRGAVAPGSASSRSLSSSIYDSSSSNLPGCIKPAMDALRRKKRLRNSTNLGNKRKCTSNAELHLVCFHRCDHHPGEMKETLDLDGKTTSSNNNNNSCPYHDLLNYSRPRHSKSCSELNDVLQGHYSYNSLNSMNSASFVSSTEMNKSDYRNNSVPLSDIAITINGCPDEGLGSREMTIPPQPVNSPETKRRYLNP